MILGYASCMGETLIDGLLPSVKEIVAVDARVPTMLHVVDNELIFEQHNFTTLKEIYSLAKFDCVYSFSYTDEAMQFNQIEAEELATEKGICFIPIITKHIAIASEYI